MVQAKLKHHIIYYSANVLIGLLGFLPYRWMGFLGRVFGRLVFKLAKKEQDKTIRNIRKVFSQTMTWNQSENLARSVWIGLGRNLFEVARWVSMSREEIISHVDRV